MGPAGALAAGAAADPKLRVGAVVAAGAAVLAGPKEKPPKAPLAEAGAELAAGAVAGAAADPKEKPPNDGCDAAPGTMSASAILLLWKCAVLLSQNSPREGDPHKHFTEDGP